ncbi:MAG: NhaP-type Na+/H+ or K+/H+ antiporter, partial [Planctomycetota bacterium]
MEPTTLVVIAFCVFAFGLVSHRIENTPLTAPMLFVTIGLLAGPFGLDLIHLEGATADIIIEVTLVLVLFSDASRIRFRELRRGYRLPARLLLLGLPLTIGLGAVIAWLIFPTLSWAELAL